MSRGRTSRPRSDDGGPASDEGRQPVRRARRREGGSFVVEREDAGEEIHARRDGEGWHVEGLGGLGSLERVPGGGFVLDVPTPAAAGGRTTCPIGLGRDAGVRHLLLDDGRLYRVVFRAIGPWPVEVHGWEVNGAYLTAGRDGKDWVFCPTVAGEAIDDLRSLTLLVAAEIFDAETSWRDQRDEWKT